MAGRFDVRPCGTPESCTIAIYQLFFPSHMQVHPSIVAPWRGVLLVKISLRPRPVSLYFDGAIEKNSRPSE
jgi:hypothetical protein